MKWRWHVSWEASYCTYSSSRVLYGTVLQRERVDTTQVHKWRWVGYWMAFIPRWAQSSHEIHHTLLDIDYTKPLLVVLLLLDSSINTLVLVGTSWYTWIGIRSIRDKSHQHLRPLCDACSTMTSNSWWLTRAKHAMLIPSSYNAHYARQFDERKQPTCAIYSWLLFLQTNHLNTVLSLFRATKDKAMNRLGQREWLESKETWMSRRVPLSGFPRIGKKSCIVENIYQCPPINRQSTKRIAKHWLPRWQCQQLTPQWGTAVHVRC